MSDADRRRQTSRADLSAALARAPAPLGLREQNKLDKRQRIRAASRELFAKLGYEEATLRQIAKRAHVGLGTLFNYADDKRDLVFLIFNEELEAITERALKSVRPEDRFIDQLTSFFRVYYREFGREPTLSRILLQELTFYSHGKQAAQFQDHRVRLIARIEKLVAAAQDRQRIRANVDPALVARHIFLVYSAAIRQWIGGEAPNPERGVEELRELLHLQFEGLGPAMGEA